MRGKKYLLTGFLILFCLWLSACTDSNDVEEKKYYLYYANRQMTGLVQEPYQMEATETKAQIDEIISALKKDPDSSKYQRIVPENLEILDYSFENSQLFLNVNDEYSELDNVSEILLRAALVKSFVQIAEVEYVGIRIEGIPLLDLSETPVGLMNDSSFIESSNGDVNAYQYSIITLYFANEEGDAMIQELLERRYSSSKSLEMLVVESLIQGPEDKTLKGVLSPDVKVLSAEIKNNICYVDFDADFLNSGEVEDEVALYALVNSLIDTCQVGGVQISVDGSYNRVYGTNLNLNNLYTRNADLIQIREITETVDEESETEGESQMGSAEDSTQRSDGSVGMESIIDNSPESQSETQEGDTQN